MPQRAYGIPEPFAADSIVCEGGYSDHRGEFLKCDLFKGKYNLSGMASTKLVIRAPLDCGVGSDANQRRGVPGKPTRTTIVCKPRGWKGTGRLEHIPPRYVPPPDLYVDSYGRRRPTYP